jgi:hypothetical protein
MVSSKHRDVADWKTHAEDAEEGKREMTKVKLASGEEVEIKAEASDVDFVQALIALNDQITSEINIQAKGLLFNSGGEGTADSFNRLKSLVGEMHALLSDASLTDAK